MTRQISSAVCRNPEVYREVCENILRVDINVLKSEYLTFLIGKMQYDK